jgi:predicted DsbA family dithiol-disulfide isomerase
VVLHRQAQARSAIAQLREEEPDLPFEVRGIPSSSIPTSAQGVDRKAYLQAKFGGAERAKQVYERVTAAGRSVGIPFDFDAIERQPNTLDAHRLVAWAQSRNEGDADALVEGLFRANFLEGRYVGSTDELVALAEGRASMRRTPARILESDALKDVVAESDRRARGDGHRRRAVLHLRRQDRVVRRAGAVGDRRGHSPGARRGSGDQR